VPEKAEKERNMQHDMAFEPKRQLFLITTRNIGRSFLTAWDKLGTMGRKKLHAKNFSVKMS